MPWRPIQSLVCLSLLLPAIRAQAERQDEFVYESAPFPQCHASTLAESPSGLVAAWFGGTEEKHPDVGIWVARRTDAGWTPPKEVANGVQHSTLRHPCWNPVLHQVPGGPLLLFYKAGPDPASWWGMLTQSHDDGETWTVPVRLPDQISGPVKNKPILMKDGKLLCPSSTEDHGWRLHMEWTSDNGLTWTRTGPLNDGVKQHAIQPTVLTHADGSLQALCRSRGTGKVVSLRSSDGGANWSPLEETVLPNPNSGIDGVTLADGRHLLVYNHTRRGRSPLNVAISSDGKAWFAAEVLESLPGEYSYPAVIQSSDGRIHISYTWKRQRVKHVTLDPKELKLEPMPNGEWPQ